jgi:hypothetical protein
LERDGEDRAPHELEPEIERAEPRRISRACFG